MKELTLDERERVGREMQSRGLEAIDFKVVNDRLGLGVVLELAGGAVLIVSLLGDETRSIFIAEDREDPRIPEQREFERLHN